MPRHVQQSIVRDTLSLDPKHQRRRTAHFRAHSEAHLGNHQANKVQQCQSFERAGSHALGSAKCS
jgi:hypothetical protein